MKSYAYVKLAHAVLFDKNLSDKAKVLYAVLQSHGMNGQNPCLPSARRLAEELGVEETTVWRALKELKDAGLIGRTRRMNNSAVTHLANLDSVYDKPDNAFISNRNPAILQGTEHCNFAGSDTANLQGRTLQICRVNKKQGNKKQRELAAAAAAAQNQDVKDVEDEGNVAADGNPPTPDTSQPDPDLIYDLTDALKPMDGPGEPESLIVYNLVRERTLKRYPEATPNDIKLLCLDVCTDLVRWNRRDTLRNFKAAVGCSVGNFLIHGIASGKACDILDEPIDVSVFFEDP